MSRTLKTTYELLQMAKHEIAKLNVCSGLYIGPVNLREPDETGCNWNLGLSGGKREQLYNCLDAIKEIVQKMRSEFNADV